MKRSRRQADAAALRGGIDEPMPGARVPRRSLAVRGWSAWGDRPALAVAVLVDGQLVGTAVVGTEARPDVGEVLDDPAMIDTGWSVTADLCAVAVPGVAEVTVVVWGDVASPPVVLPPVRIELTDDEPPVEEDTAEFSGSLELPRSGELVGPELVRLFGWILHRDRPVSGLDVLVDGHPAGSVRLGIDRPDVAEAHEQPEGAISGFDAIVDLGATAPTATAVTLELVARAAGVPPTVVFERAVPLAPRPSREDRADRDRVLQDRRRHLLAATSGGRDGPLDLLVFTHDLQYGGAQLWLHEFLRSAGAGARFTTTVVAQRDGPLRLVLEGEGIPVHVNQPCGAEDPEAYEGRVSELISYLASGRQNACLVNTVNSHMGADVAYRLGLPTVWAIHESLTPPAFWFHAYEGRMSPAVRAVAERALASASAVAFVAEATRQLYVPWTGPDRAIVIPYGIDTSSVSAFARRVSQPEARSMTGLPPGSRVALVMGTIEPRKGQTRVAQAFEQLRQRDPDLDWLLLFVGDGGGPYSEGLRRYLADAGLEDRARVVPLVGDTAPWYRAADFLLSASDSESMPRSALEAMCFGLPVVMTDIFGVPELLTDGKNGLLFEVHDLEAMIGAVHRVLTMDKALLSAIGAAGRRHVLEHYDAAGYVEDLMALIEALRRDPAVTPGEALADRGRKERGASSKAG